MIRVDDRWCRAPVEECLRVAGAVDRWPEFLPHYRWVRFRSQRGFAEGTVEMAAWRPFGVVRYPTWWVSDMWFDAEASIIHYRHIEGITRGMDVRWEFKPDREGTMITIVHEWAGPRWPLIGPLAASAIIGPIFISGIARRTLAGVARDVERTSDR